MSIYNNDDRSRLCNPHDIHNYIYFKESPYYSRRGMVFESHEIAKGKCSPFTVIEKTIFKGILIFFVISCFVILATSSIDNVLTLISALLPLFLFGICLPYLVMREVVFSIVKKIKN